MGLNEVRDFFNRLAPFWDADMIKDDNIIGIIMDNCGVSENVNEGVAGDCDEGISVLDVASGTGVMIPYYMERKVADVTAVDIADKMCDIMRTKFLQLTEDGRLTVICDDVLTHEFDRKFDVVMVYNAFPHFQDSEEVVRVLSGLLKEGGRLSIAHGMSRAAIEKHHENCPKNVSVSLMEAEELKELFGKYLKVTHCISNERMYQVVGVRQ